MSNKNCAKTSYSDLKNLLKNKSDVFLHDKKIIALANDLIEQKEEYYYLKLLSLVRFRLNEYGNTQNIPSFSDCLDEKFLSKRKNNNKKNNIEFEIFYEKIRKKITSKKKLELYSKIVLDFSKNLLENKEYEIHDKLSSLIRFHSKEGSYRMICYSIPYILYEENIIDKELYNTYKENFYYTRVNKKEQYYYLKDNNSLFDKYYKEIKPKDKLKYNIEYFINNFIVNKNIIENKFSKSKKKLIIKSL